MAAANSLLLLFLLTSGFTTLRAQTNLNDVEDMLFTEPLYHGVVRERAVSAIVQSDVMMGIWLSNSMSDLQFDIIGGDNRFDARKKVLGNFAFLELRTTSLTRSQNVRIRAKSRRLNWETFCTVHVEVLDVNNFEPLFPPETYSVTIPENTKVGSTIIFVEATDSDRDPDNTRFYYSFPKYASDYFAVHPTTGAVILAAPLNAESQPVHSVFIQATDRKAVLAGVARPRRTTLTVSVERINNHSPTITFHDPLSYSSDASSRVYAILQVFDPDSGSSGQVSAPRIVHCDVSGLLGIEPRVGTNDYNLVFTGTSTNITGTINVTIEVSDLGVPPRSSNATLNVKIFNRDDFLPVFSPSRINFTVSEISPVHTQVGYASAQLAGNGVFNNLRYSVVSGNEDSFFTISENTSLITTAKLLQGNAGSEFKLRVEAVNTQSAFTNSRSFAFVTVCVQDANDHDPIFTRDVYVADITENSPVGTTVIRVEARDVDHGINGSVVYHLMDSKDLPLDIDPFSGTIFTTGTLDADVLGRVTFNVRVRAQDRGVPFSRKSEAYIKINIISENDQAPVFNQVNCVIKVPISTPIDVQVVLLEAIDIDRDPVTCAIVSGRNRWFEIDPGTCSIRLASRLSNSQLSNEYTLKITASDGQHTSTPNEVTIRVVRSGQIKRSCTDTGAIKSFEEALNNLRIHNSIKEESATNLTRTSQLPNKYRPVVKLPNAMLDVSVSEDAELGSIVTRIRALDRDTGYNGKLWFTIISGNLDSCFLINTQNGYISLGRPLDRERTAFYILAVEVSDLGLPSKSQVVRINITVTDANDNRPVFGLPYYSFQIPEDVPVGYQLQNRIVAKDSDVGKNAEIRYRLSPKHSQFFINPVTGMINVTKNLDRESVPDYNLTVIAADSSPMEPLSSTVNVIIRVSDVNDNAPRFYQSLYRIQIAEDLPVHTVLFWLQARDPDAGENGQVRYSLTDGVSNKFFPGQPRFRVDDRTGALRLSSALSAREQRFYNITARARDAKKLYSTCYIEVQVLPVNRNLHAPYFEQQIVRMEVKENVTIGSQIGVVSAMDEDLTEPEREVEYFVTDGTGLGIFEIDQNTGIITNTRNLDRETEQYYWLTVVAEDRAFAPLSGHIFVLIEVTDVNDNVPQADQQVYIFSVVENTPVGTNIGRIQASDRDAGANGRFTFSMADNMHFEVDSNDGILRTAGKSLDREEITPNQLQFDVTISNAGTLLFSVVRVRINITDVNDNFPVFSTTLKRTVQVPERNRTQLLQPITKIVAWDSDDGRNGEVVYMLDFTPEFAIDSHTGVISTQHQFNEGQLSVVKITAFDQGKPQLSSKFRLEIEWSKRPNLSTYPPVFENDCEEEIYSEHVDIYYVSEKSLQRRVIRLLHATDIDSDHIWYRIADGNDNHMFGINDDNALFVIGNPDAEIQNRYNLTIEASDGYNVATKQIIVHIDDTNDNPPVFINKTFTASANENSPPGSHVVKLSATDKDLSAKNRNYIFRIRSSLDPLSANKFRITTFGDIVTTTELDREVQQTHVLTVEVDDQGVPGSLQDYCQVVIYVTDENEHAPQFTSSSYSTMVYLKEQNSVLGFDDSENEIVLKVHATDPDRGRNAKVVYSISQGNDEQLWSINAVTGEMKATRKVGSTKRHRLIVTATDQGKTPLSSFAIVHINAVSSSDVTPEFEENTLNTSISENRKVGSFVAKVSARAPSGVWYEIESGNKDLKFAINPHSGVLSLASLLDREKQSIYNLTATAIGASGKKASAHVTVHVTDVNDNRPRFSTLSYTGYVNESIRYLASAHVLTDDKQPLKIQAYDTDSGANARLLYEIIDATVEINKRFFIDSFTGAVDVKPGENLFNYNSVKEYQFKVRAVDFGNPRLSSENFALVTIHLIETNDSVPVFRETFYNFTLHLPTIEGFLVNMEQSRKWNMSVPKRNPITYSLIGSSDNSAFKIDPKNGNLFVANPNLLHPGNQYSLRMRISNGKRFSTAKATVSVENFSHSSLRFTQEIYEAEVTENTAQVKALASVHVADAKLEDNFRFTVLNPTPGFDLGFTSGVISTTGIPIDREKSKLVKLLVEVVDVHRSEVDSDGDLRRGRCIVHVTVNDVNDNSPQFTKPLYTAIVRRNAQPRTQVIKVTALDLDDQANSMIYYSLRGTNLFDIGSRTGVVTLRRTPVDADFKINVTIAAQDKGTPTLRGHALLTVSFVDQSTPIFTQNFYGDIHVPEDARPYTVISVAVKATASEDEKVFYTIEDGNAGRKFDVDFFEGTLTTVGKLDREEQSLYRLRVRARAEHSRAFADAEVEVRVGDVNDNSPIFSERFYNSAIAENTVVRSAVLQVHATDLDSNRNGEMVYSIVEDSSNDGEHFLIDSVTGMIWTARELDRETKSSFSFQVRASDFGVPSRHSDVRVTITIDDNNDHPPVFEKLNYEFAISDEALKYNFVGHVRAWDSDQNVITYSINEQLNPNSYLQINPDTGLISLKKNFDSETSSFTICVNVTASDGVFTSVTNVNVRVTSESVVLVEFKNASYSFQIFENEPVDTLVGNVSATGSGSVIYTVATNTIFSDFFRIESHSGRLMTSEEVDRELLERKLGKTKIEIDITATDETGYIAMSSVSIEILDRNDNAPTFSRDRYEVAFNPSETAIGDVVINVSTCDIDSGVNSRISYFWNSSTSSNDNYFHLNANTGLITVAKKLESIGHLTSVQFFVKAIDHGEPPLHNYASVTVYFISDSDRIPAFPLEMQSFEIEENLPIGTEVATLQAQVGAGEQRYALEMPCNSENFDQDGNPFEAYTSLPFLIDASTGEITTSTNLDREERETYYLTVIATTTSVPQLTASTIVILHVTDTNDNDPEFLADTYHVSVLESSPLQELPVTVKALDRDTGPYGTVTFSFKNDDFGGKFRINNVTGKISLESNLDRELQSTYELIIEATDGGLEKGANKRRSSICHVIIEVIDVNDTPPRFSKKEYEITVAEDSPIHYESPQFIHAYDKDAGSHLEFYITEGDLDGHFQLKWNRNSRNDSYSISIEIIKPLDFETKQPYDVTVLASDGLHSSTTRARILVGDVNDNSVQCQQLSYFGKAPENSPLRLFIIRVHSSDSDSGVRGRVEYSLSGKYSSMFDIDPQSGKIFTASRLDREKTSEFNLVAVSRDSDGLSCTSKVHIEIEDTNDNAPVFDASTLFLSVRENIPVDSILHRVVAHDDDMGENGTFHFSLTGDSDGQFYIEPDSGVVILKKPLDREKVSFYEVQIQVRDQGRPEQLSSTSVLRVNVLDVNDSPPVFEQAQYKAAVKEDSAVGEVVGRVSAMSLDIGANAKLKYSIVRGNEHRKFTIDRNTGIVSLAGELDFETDQNYVIKISAYDVTDQPLSSECVMRVDVIDVNDNPPEFTSSDYEVFLSEDASVGHVLLTVHAADKDSGRAGQVAYRLSPSSGPFQIDRATGALSLSRPGLDYEAQKSYRILVTAFDSGTPPFQAQAAVTVNVLDVNDNRPQITSLAPPGGDFDLIDCPPRGANCTVYLLDGSADTVNTGIILLNATDADSDANSAPFFFRIKSGNNDGLFYLNQNILKTVTPLKLEANSKKLIRRITIVVEDSGSPIRLTSAPNFNLNVVVVKESVYPPKLTPHDITVVIGPDTADFSGGLLNHRLHALNRRTVDNKRLRYFLASPNDFEQFVMDPLTGAINATSPLSVGTRQILLRASSGSQFAVANISLSVIQLTWQAANCSVSVIFHAVKSPQEYLNNYHWPFVRTFKKVLPIGFDESRDFLLISLRAKSDKIEMLFAIRKPRTARKYYLSKSVRSIVENNRQLFEETLQVQIASVQGRECAVDNCAHGECQQLLSFTSPVLLASNDSYSVVGPLFTREKRCKCPPGTTGTLCASICSPGNNPCRKPFSCRVDLSEELEYTCDPPKRANAVMAFTGRSIIQYSLHSSVQNKQFQADFRIRTYQSNSTVFVAEGENQLATLQVESGFTKFTFDCGDGRQTILNDMKQVTDGRWTDVSIKLINNAQCSFKLILNGKLTTTVHSTAQRKFRPSFITFGGERSMETRSKRSSQKQKDKYVGSTNVENGFTGCIQKAQINGYDVSLTSSSGIQLDQNAGVSNKCTNSLIDMGACASQPCLNGGKCFPLTDGLHECQCPLVYDGENCEQLNQCASLPCKNNGMCLNNDDQIRCICVHGFTGIHCEVSLACLKADQCRNGAACTTDRHGHSSCVCERGWTGRHCEVDVDECQRPEVINDCGGRNKCFNYDGGYACNCTDSLKGTDCSFVPAPEPAPTVEPLVLIIVAVCAGVVVLIALVTALVCWRKRKRMHEKRYRSGSRRSEDITPVRRFSPSNLNRQQTVSQQNQFLSNEYQRNMEARSYLDPRNMTALEQRSPVVGLVHPQIPVASFSVSAASDNGSVQKSLQQEYEQRRIPASTSSSVHHLPSSRTRSASSMATDQQSYMWDIVDGRSFGSSSFHPSIASAPYAPISRRGTFDIPSSPESHRSLTSQASTRRSQRSDALPGHYNVGRRRRQKQLLQMIALKERNEQENLQIQSMLSHLFNQELQDEVYSHPSSRHSTIRSTLSRRPSSSLRHDPMGSTATAESSLIDPYPQRGPSNRSDVPPSQRKKEKLQRRRRNPGHSVGSSLDKTPESDSAPNYPVNLSLPPTDFELMIMKKENEKPFPTSSLALPTHNHHTSSSSLPSSSIDIGDQSQLSPKILPLNSGKFNGHHQVDPSNHSISGLMVSDSHDHNGPSLGSVQSQSKTPPSHRKHKSGHLVELDSLSSDEAEVQSLIPSSDVAEENIRAQNRRLQEKLGANRKHDDLHYEQLAQLLPVVRDETS